MALTEDKIQQILNFENYYSAGTMDYGIDGPELTDGTVYISVYHFLEFMGEKPWDYDTFKMGQAFYGITSDRKKCKYLSQNFEIGKYSFELIEERMDIVEQFKK